MVHGEIGQWRLFAFAGSRTTQPNSSAFSVYAGSFPQRHTACPDATGTRQETLLSEIQVTGIEPAMYRVAVQGATLGVYH